MTPERVRGVLEIRTFLAIYDAGMPPCRLKFVPGYGTVFVPRNIHFFFVGVIIFMPSKGFCVNRNGVNTGKQTKI